MDMADSTLWWIAAGVLVGIELLTGTFYLLMVALGLAGAAIAAMLGASQTTQIAAAAILGAGAVFAWHLYQAKRKPSANDASNLDVGATVLVTRWDADGSTSVSYRGAKWRAALVPGESPQTGPHRIESTDGNSLLIKKI